MNMWWSYQAKGEEKKDLREDVVNVVKEDMEIVSVTLQLLVEGEMEVL